MSVSVVMVIEVNSTGELGGIDDDDGDGGEEMEWMMMCGCCCFGLVDSSEFGGCRSRCLPS